MGQVLHSCATTTHAVRAAIQRSQASVAELAAQYGINQKTVRKWRARKSVEDQPMGPASPRSTSLSPEEEAACVAFRKHTLLALDDCLYALQATIPHLTRSSLHRLFQRHAISRLPDTKCAKPKKAFKTYPIDYLHIDIAEVRTEEGKLHMFVAIDRTSKAAFVQLHERANTKTAVAFLNDLVEAMPYAIHTVLTDNGPEFAGRLLDQWAYLNKVELDFSRPGKPTDNAYVEAFNSRLRQECLNTSWFLSMEDARTRINNWRTDYNQTRPHSSLGNLTPSDFAAQLNNTRKVA